MWHDGLHPIPDGLLLGVPGRRRRASPRSRPARRRAASCAPRVEPLLPRTADPDDSIGALVRARFGDEVHERLVDALVGSIYAADTDRFSLAMVPQLAALADGQRSLLLGARRARRDAIRADRPGVPRPARRAWRRWRQRRRRRRATGGGDDRRSRRAGARPSTADGARWRVDGEPFDAVVLATPGAADRADCSPPPRPTLAGLLGDDGARRRRDRHARRRRRWPDAAARPQRLPRPQAGPAARHGRRRSARRSGRHWRGDGGEVLRVSLGRDGLPVDDLDDDALVDRAVDRGRPPPRRSTSQPTAVRGQPLAAGVPAVPPAPPATGSPRSTPPLPPGLFVTGASYRGIGIPACIADAERTAAGVAAYLAARV